MALVGDAGSLRTLLQALANAPSRLPRKTRFLPLKWVDAHIDAATLAVAIDWIQTLSTPEERVREIGSQRTANRALDVKTLDLLWEGSAAWLSQPGPDSDDAFAQSLLGLLRPVHPSNRMDEAELVWLNRLIRCRPDAPPLEVFENFNSSYHAQACLEQLADALEGAFAPAPLQACASDRLNRLLNGQSYIDPMDSPWVDVALVRGWLNASARQNLFASTAQTLIHNWGQASNAQKLFFREFLNQGVELNAPFRGADLRAAYEGRQNDERFATTALHCAIENHEPDLVALLLAHGSDPAVRRRVLNDTGKPIGPGQDAFEWFEAVCFKPKSPLDSDSRVADQAHIGSLLQAHRSKCAVNDLLAEIGAPPKAPSGP